MNVLLVLVAREGEDEPFVVGAFNGEFLDTLPQEDAEAAILALKETWTMDPSHYEWRTCRVGLDEEELTELFDIPEVNGYWER